MQRKLAAILAADVVGYSRMMGADEEGTLARLKSLRAELFSPKVSEHCGRIVKVVGDGALVEFASAVGAVNCAIDIQRTLAKRNAALPQDQRIVLRIGINVGDVIVEGSDIYGDGVNVAARLEGLAEPGSVWISRTVRDQIRDKLPFRLEDRGEQTVKNIARPVRAFCVLAEPEPPRAVQESASANGPPNLPDKPSIVVLPFANMSGEKEQDYFSDGISEDIITELSKAPGLFVIARNSAFAYKDQTIDLRAVSKALGVRYVLEGSVRKAGDRVRVNAQLIDGTTGGHVWADRYDRQLTDIFAVQDDLTGNIVGALRGQLAREYEAAAHRGRPANLRAYDLFLRGRDFAWLHTADANRQAQRHLSQSISEDSSFAPAYAMLAYTKMIDYANQWSDRATLSLAEGLELARRAKSIDPADAFAWFVEGAANMWMRRLDEALNEIERAIELDPNLAHAHACYGLVRIYAGRPGEAIEPVRTAIRLDPLRCEVFLHFLGLAYFLIGDYETAADSLRQRLALNPATDATRALLSACYGKLGRFEEAKREWAELIERYPDYSIAKRRQVLPFRNPADFDQILDGLGRAGLPTG